MAKYQLKCCYLCRLQAKTIIINLNWYVNPWKALLNALHIDVDIDRIIQEFHLFMRINIFSIYIRPLNIPRAKHRHTHSNFSTERHINAKLFLESCAIILFRFLMLRCTWAVAMVDTFLLKQPFRYKLKIACME